MHATHSPTTVAVSTPPPQEVIMHMLMGMWSAQAVATAARLGIADALANSQPQDSTALAHAVGADAGALARLLRTLVSLGLLAQPQPHTYALTALGEVLRSDTPGSMRDVLIAETDTPHWQAWGKLHESVRSGQPVVPELFGMPIFAYYAAHPEELASFKPRPGWLFSPGRAEHCAALRLFTRPAYRRCWGGAWRPLAGHFARQSSGARYGVRAAARGGSGTSSDHRPGLSRAV